MCVCRLFFMTLKEIWNTPTFLSCQNHLWETSQCIYRGTGSFVPSACGWDIPQHPLLCLQHWWITHTHKCNIIVSLSWTWTSVLHTLCNWLFFFCLVADDPNAIKDLMQMRLTGGGGGMMAEKLEVKSSWALYVTMLVLCINFRILLMCNMMGHANGPHIWSQ